MKSRIHLSEHFTYSKLLMFTLPSIVMNVFLSLYIVVDGYFVANFTGKTEFAAVTVCAGLCNILLDAICIIAFKWGIVGAALASALSQIVGGVFPLMYFICKNNSLLKLVKPAWDGKALFRCITNGSSEFMAEAAASFVGIIYNVQLLKYVGEDGVVIYGMLMYVSLIFSAMFVGYSNGIGPVIGYHFGAQDHRELKNLRKRSLMIIGLSSVSMFYSFGNTGASVFRYVSTGDRKTPAICRTCFSHCLCGILVYRDGDFWFSLLYCIEQRPGISADIFYAELCV